MTFNSENWNQFMVRRGNGCGNAKDIQNADHIYGVDVESLKAKLVKTNMKHMIRYNSDGQYVCSQEHQNVTLDVDIKKVHNIPFLITL